MGALISKSFGSKDAKKGEKWTYKLYFDPEADKHIRKSHEISVIELLDELPNLVNVDEPIINIWAYKEDLFWWQISRLIIFHMFIVFETKDWWWSIEKNSEGITIQRSKKHEAVKKMYRGKERYRHTLMLDDKGNKTMEGLIIWLAGEERDENGVILLPDIITINDYNRFCKGYRFDELIDNGPMDGRFAWLAENDILNKENQLNKKYNYIFSNCRHFAKEVFNYIAATKKYEPGVF